MTPQEAAEGIAGYINNIGRFMSIGSGSPNFLNPQYLGLLYGTFRRARESGHIPGWDAIVEHLGSEGVHPETIDDVQAAWTLWRFAYNEDHPEG